MEDAACLNSSSVVTIACAHWILARTRTVKTQPAHGGLACNVAQD